MYKVYTRSYFSMTSDFSNFKREFYDFETYNQAHHALIQMIAKAETCYDPVVGFIFRDPIEDEDGFPQGEPIMTIQASDLTLQTIHNAPKHISILMNEPFLLV